MTGVPPGDTQTVWRPEYLLAVTAGQARPYAKASGAFDRKETHVNTCKAADQADHASDRPSLEPAWLAADAGPGRGHHREHLRPVGSAMPGNEVSCISTRDRRTAWRQELYAGLPHRNPRRRPVVLGSEARKPHRVVSTTVRRGGRSFLAARRIVLRHLRETASRWPPRSARSSPRCCGSRAAACASPSSGRI
jgi:hypothetical protein